MSRSVRWRSLELEGFGVYDRPVRFEFPAGLGVLCLPNERGKSTLVAGLRAALFGLRERDAKAGHSIERFKSWKEAAAFRAVLEIESEERRLLITRDFATHRVRLARLDAMGRPAEKLFDGEHNPGARGASRAAWESHLARILGDAGVEETFLSTFLLEQPLLPAPAIGDSVRQLVGGVGRIGGTEAKERLFETVRKLTQKTGDRDLVPAGGSLSRNQMKAGRIEMLEEETASLDARMQRAVRAFEEQRSLEDAFVLARDAHERARGEEEEARRRLESLTAYRRTAEAREAARAACQDLGAALAAHDEAEAAAARADARLAAEFADLAGAPADLQGWITDARERRAALAELRSTLDRREKEARDCAERLEAATREAESYADLDGRPEDFPGLVSALVAARAEADRLRARLAEMETESKAGREHLESVPWIRALGPGSESRAATWLVAARGDLNRWIEAARAFLAIESRAAALEEELRPLAPVAELPQEVADAIADSDRVHAERRRAEQLTIAIERQREQIAERREELTARLRLADGIPRESFLAALKARSEARRRIGDLDTEIATIEAKAGRRTLRPVVLAVLAAAVLGVAAGAILYSMQAPLAAAAGIGLGLAAIPLAAYLIAGPPGARARAMRRRSALAREMRSLAGRLSGEHIPSGPWMPDDEGLFERAKAFFTQTEEEMERLASQDAALDSDGAAADPALPVLEQLEASEESLSQATGQPAGEAVRRYRELSLAIEVMREKRGDALRAMGLEAAMGSPDPLGSSPVPVALAASCRVLGLGCGTARELLVTLSRTDESFWSAREEESQSSAVLLRRIEEIERDRTRIAAEDLPNAGRRIEELAAACAPFGPETDLTRLRERWDRRNEVLHRKAVLASAARQSEESLGAMRAEVREAQERLNALTALIGDERLAASGSAVERLADRLEERATLMRLAATEREKAAGALKTARGGPYEGRASLVAALGGFEAKRGDAAASIDRMEDASEWLAAQAGLSAEERDRRRCEAEERHAAAQAELDRAREGKANAEAALAAWRPEESESIAALELAVEARRSELQALRTRADAAADAWHLLDGAIREFQSTHRAILGERIDAAFSRIAGREGRRIVLTEDLGLRILEEGREVPENSLSQGARDQLSFCLRLALADLMAGDLLLPVILDDPFVHSDSGRLDRIREILTAAAADRQVLFLTQDERLLGWGEPIRRVRRESDALIA